MDSKNEAQAACEAIRHAADILEDEAHSLKGCHTRPPFYDWSGEAEAKEQFDDFKATAAKLNEIASLFPALSAQPAVQVPQDAALQFADHIINGAFDGGDWNGGDLQDLAADYGLLKLEEMAAPCSEEEQGCRCARDGADFPVCCFRKTYRLPTPTANPSEGAGE